MATSGKNKIYYLVKSSKKYKTDGVFEKIVDVAKRDPLRKKMMERLKDEKFRREVLGMKDIDTDEAIRLYQERIGKMVDPDDRQMCVDMYELGDQKESKEGKVLVTMKNGEDRWFDRETSGAAELCTYDPEHDGPLDELPEDVSAISGFGVAALLIVIRRTLIEKLQQFTYVGDVVIAVNPYMYLPQMVRIHQPPEVKAYRFGEEPSVYATAHFSYWGLMKPEQYFVGCPRNQSCIVSGESGAGKTVSCGQIMKYLANMSDWARGITRRGSSGNAHAMHAGTKDVTKLVSGVSPFLESFGNANTVMNDNSSRFGKFQKILFNDNGNIVGGEVDHYLLEKGRLSYQGKRERNYHIFYFLIKGKTPEEQKVLNLRPAKEYGMLFGGGIDVILHENHKKSDGTVVNTYDIERMNNPLDDDADKTGCRAALTAANVSLERQADMWKTLAALLKMGDLKFVNGKDGQNTSEVENKELCDTVSRLLGLDHVSEEEGLARMLCIYRREIKGEKPIDSPVSPTIASFQRFALIKDIYSRMFDELMRVVNRVLEPEDSHCGFIGILDIFGFEVFEYNSMEQLCINFANEKLQKLFNEHIFVEEGKIYKKEDLPLDVLPPFRDNTPCCNLIERKNVGIFPMLDDFAGKTSATDEQYARLVFKRYGFKRHKPGKLAATKAEKAAAEYISGKMTDPMWFKITHFAGDVRYHTKDWLKKNEDKLPPQIPELMVESKSEYIRDYVYMKDGLPAEDRERVGKLKKKKPKKNTIACKFILSLKELAHTLGATNPHYVRCVKPNDVHMRPCDGAIAFDAAKTYRQLLYAGVMEVCKIKKEGYPFREPYERFWEKRCVQNKWINLMVPSLDKSMDAKKGVIAMCEAVMPAPRLQGQKPHQVVRPTWVPGKTMLFGKDYTLDTFERWHKEHLALTLQRWTRINVTFTSRLREFLNATARIQSHYRRILDRRRMAKVEAFVVRAQCMLRAAKFRQEYAKRRDLHRSVRVVQHAHRHFWLWRKWDRTNYDLKRIHLVKEAAEKVQVSFRNHVQAENWRQVMLGAIKRNRVERVIKAYRNFKAYESMFYLEEALRKRDSVLRIVTAYRNYCAYRNYFESHDALVHKGSRRILELMATICSRKLANRTIGLRLKLKHRNYFRTIRIQKHVRSTLALKEWSKQKAWYGGMKTAADRALSVWHMKEGRQFFFNCTRGHVAATEFFETVQSRVWIRTQVRATIVIQSFVRKCLRASYVARRVGATVRLQQAVRFRRIWKRFEARESAAAVVETFLYKSMLRIRCAQWIEHMHAVTASGDLDAMMDMMNCQAPYKRLKVLRHEVVPVRGGDENKQVYEYNGLVNLRDRVFVNSFLHTATNSGNINAVQYLIHQGADPEALNIMRNTPVHLAAADGDRSLHMTTSLINACKTKSKINSNLLWVLSHEGANEDGVTVMDKAIACDGPNKNTIAYLSMKESRYHPKIKKDVDEIKELKRRADLVERHDLMRNEEKHAQMLSQDEAFKFMMLDPSRTDRRARQLDMSDEQKQADLAMTAAFTVGLAASKLNRVLRGDLKLLEEEEKKGEENVALEKFVIASTEDEEAKVRMDEKLRESTLNRVQILKSKLAELNEKKNEESETKTTLVSSPVASKNLKESVMEKLRSGEMEVDSEEEKIRREEEERVKMKRASMEVHALQDYLNRTKIEKNLQEKDRKEQEEIKEREEKAMRRKREEEQQEKKAREDAAWRLQNERARKEAMEQEMESLRKQIDRMEGRNKVVESNPMKRRDWMFRALLSYERLSSSDFGWQYLDANGTIHGPFSTVKMRSWFRHGYFSIHLPVRYNPKDPFISLSEMFKPTETAFASSVDPARDLMDFKAMFT